MSEHFIKIYKGPNGDYVQHQVDEHGITIKTIDENDPLVAIALMIKNMPKSE